MAKTLWIWGYVAGWLGIIAAVFFAYGWLADWGERALGYAWSVAFDAIVMAAIVLATVLWAREQ